MPPGFADGLPPLFAPELSIDPSRRHLLIGLPRAVLLQVYGPRTYYLHLLHGLL